MCVCVTINMRVFQFVCCGWVGGGERGGVGGGSVNYAQLCVCVCVCARVKAMPSCVCACMFVRVCVCVFTLCTCTFSRTLSWGVLCSDEFSSL